jgi:hypothetical protein
MVKKHAKHVPFWGVGSIESMNNFSGRCVTMRQHVFPLLVALVVWIVGSVVGLWTPPSLGDESSTAWTKCQSKENDVMPDNPAQNCVAVSGGCANQCEKWVALQTTLRCQGWAVQYYCWERQRGTLADYYTAPCQAWPHCDSCGNFTRRQSRIWVPWYQCTP